MSAMDSYESDMVWLSKLNDEDIERVLAGEYPGEELSLRALATYAKDVKDTFSVAPAEGTRVTHLMAIAEATADLDATPAPVLTPAPSGPLRRLKLVLTSLFASLIGKIALASVALAATTGGLAATGSLPDAAQDALARAGDKVGIDLPLGDDRATHDDGAGVPDELPEATEGSSAPSVLDIIRSWGDDKGCEFGHAVATAAGGDPGPCSDEQSDDEDGAKKPEGTPKGKPEGAGKPEGTPQGKPAGAGEGEGKPEGTPDGKPDGAGKPEGTPGGGSEEAVENGSGNAGGGKGSNGAGAPSDLPVGGGNESKGGPPGSVPIERT
jgi:hypothetical protein